MDRHIDKTYQEYRGVLLRKYRSIFGRYIFLIDENGKRAKIYVGNRLYEATEVGSNVTIGARNHKLINIRAGICKNSDS